MTSTIMKVFFFSRRRTQHMVVLALALVSVGTFAVWAQQQESAEPERAMLPVQVEAVTHQPPPNDPLQKFTPGQFTGQLVYIAYVVEPNPKPHWQHFLVLRRAGTNNADSDTQAIITLRLKVADRAFDPQFSPDGTQVLFKVGSAYERYGSYKLYLWNIKTGELKSGPKERLSFRKAEWSLDGRYLAYVRGGDIEGQLYDKEDKLELFIHDLQTGQSRVVASGRAVTSFAWTAQNTLLYSQLPEAQKAAKDEAQDTRRPDLYEVGAQGGQPQLVLQDGYLAAPSPDGRWIGFYTSTQSDKEVPLTTRFDDQSPRQSFLSLYDRTQKTRFILRSERDSFAELRWTSGSEKLIVTKQTYSSTGEGNAQIDVVDATTQQLKAVATLKASDGQFVPRPNYAPQFIVDDPPLPQSLLPIKVYEIKSINGQLKGFGDLRLVNTLDGQISTICQFRSVSGYDWHEGK